MNEPARSEVAIIARVNVMTKAKSNSNSEKPACAVLSASIRFCGSVEVIGVLREGLAELEVEENHVKGGMDLCRFDFAA